MDDVAALREPTERRAAALVRAEHATICPAEPGDVPAPLFLARSARYPGARRCRRRCCKSLSASRKMRRGLTDLPIRSCSRISMPSASPDQIAGIFGTAFAQALLGLKEGQWQGPVESGLGWHLVWVESRIPGRVPPFEEIEATIKSEWMDEQRAEAKRKMFETMRARYQIVLPEAGAGRTPPGAAVAHAAAHRAEAATGALVFTRFLLLLRPACSAVSRLRSRTRMKRGQHTSRSTRRPRAAMKYCGAPRINAGMELPVMLKFPDDTRNITAPSVRGVFRPAARTSVDRRRQRRPRRQAHRVRRPAGYHHRRSGAGAERSTARTRPCLCIHRSHGWRSLPRRGSWRLLAYISCKASSTFCLEPITCCSSSVCC